MRTAALKEQALANFVKGLFLHMLLRQIDFHVARLGCDPGGQRRHVVLLSLAKRCGRNLGGVIGYYVIGPWEALFPYLLVVAASSFIYVAVADLIPQLQRRLSWRETLAQLGWLAAGLAAVLIAVEALHAH